MRVRRLVRRSSLPRSPPLRVLRRSQRFNHNNKQKVRNQALTQRENQGRLAPPPRGRFFASHTLHIPGTLIRQPCPAYLSPHFSFERSTSKKPVAPMRTSRT